jgi:hypothetical protein
MINFNETQIHFYNSSKDTAKGSAKSIEFSQVKECVISTEDEKRTEANEEEY